MYFSVVALCTYSLLILLGTTLSTENEVQSWIIRLIISVSFAVALATQLKRNLKIKTMRHLDISFDLLKAKVLGVRLCLISLILFSMVMGRVFSNWPAIEFDLDYLVILPVLLFIIAPWYVKWSESISPTGCDGYARLGQLLLRKRYWKWEEQKELMLSWLVKLFFIPLMYTWLVFATDSLLRFQWSLTPPVFIEGLFTYGLAIDLLIATGGYLFASRLLGNEVISTDRTWSGWLVCLLCYPPAIWVFLQVKKQSNNLIWTDWLEPSQPLFWIWGFAVTMTWIVYWLSTLHFGLRFANLSWRGLINTGPYRWVRHPAYLSKNIYWWLYLVPFYGVANGYELARNLFGLCFVSLIYYLRAYTEERHLKQFAEYRSYVDYIQKHGLLAQIKKKYNLIAGR